jgi:putative MATE family efflux protein
MRDLTSGRIGRNILGFATPMLVGNIFLQAYNVVDSIIVGQFIGKEALAAVGASFPIIFALTSFIIGIAMGGNIVVAQYFGAKDYERVRRSIDTIYIFIFFASLVVATVGIVFSQNIFRLMRLPEELIPQASQYFNTFMLGTVFLFGFNGTQAILRGLGDSVTPLIFLIIASVINVVLDIIFIRYLGMGVRGAAVATVISHGGAFIGSIFYLNKTHKLVKLQLKKMVFDWDIFWKSVKIGLPSGFQQTFVSFGMIALFRIVNHFGTNVIAAYTVAGRIENMATLPAMNFGQALSTFVGQNIGANRQDRVRSGLRSTLWMSALTSAVLTIIILIFRRQLMSMFTSDPEVIAYGSDYLSIVGLGYVIFSIMFSINGLLRGAGDTLIPMFFTLLSLWIIRIPLASLLSGRFYLTFSNLLADSKLPGIFTGSLQEKGIWLSVPIAWLTGALLSFIYYRTGKWKKKAVIKYEE